VAPANTVLTRTDSNLVNSTARYSCVNNSFRLDGPDIRLCTDLGTWTGSPPACIGEHAQFVTSGEHAQLVISGEHAQCSWLHVVNMLC